MGKQRVRRGLHELSDREISEAQSDLMLPAGGVVALFFAGSLLSLSFMLGPSALVSATRGFVAGTVATISSAIAQTSISMERQLEARASDYQPVQEPSSQAKAAETRPSRRTQCARLHPRNSARSDFLRSVLGAVGDRCRLAKRSKVRVVKINAAGKDAHLTVK
jgi:hypothetical protein